MVLFQETGIGNGPPSMNFLNNNLNYLIACLELLITIKNYTLTVNGSLTNIKP